METRNDGFVLLDENTVPALILHPGGMLGEELKARGIKQKDFAAQIGMQASHLSALINGARNFTQAIADKVAMGLDNIPASFWMGLQEQYNRRINLKKKQSLSLLVAGYTHSAEPEPVAALASPAAEYGTKVNYGITIPLKDKDLLETLSKRMGWKLESK